MASFGVWSTLGRSGSGQSGSGQSGSGRCGSTERWRSAPIGRAGWLPTVALTIAACIAIPSAGGNIVWADSWAPYQPVRVVEPAGRRYLVTEATGYTSASYRLLEIPKGGSSIVPERGPKAQVRATDRLVSHGKLPFAPMEILVLPEGRGFVLIDRYGRLGRGVVLAILSDNGETERKLELSDIYTTDQIKKFTQTVSSTWWRKGAWYEPTQDSIYLISEAGLHSVSRTTGEVSESNHEDIVRALSSDDPETRRLALTVAKSLPSDLVLPPIRNILADTQLSLKLRLTAADLCAHHLRAPERATDVDLRAARELVSNTAFSTATSNPPSEVDRAFAIEISGRVLGQGALEPLRAMFRRAGGPYWGAATRAFAEIGKPAVPALIAMLRERGESDNYRGGAAHALSKLGASEPVPALVEAIADESEYVANAAANAAIALAGASIAGDLASHLERGTTQDMRLAMYFQEHKHPKATNALITLLERKPSKLIRKICAEALTLQTGKSLGEDPEAWRKALNPLD